MSEQIEGVRERIISTLDYPKTLMDEDVKEQACSHQHSYGQEKDDCSQCLYILECQCSSDQLEFQQLQGYSINQLSKMLEFSIEYVSYHARRDGHHENSCDCGLCSWLKKAAPLLTEV